MQNGTLVKTLFLKASPEKVWAYLTEKDKLAKWFNPSGDNLSNGKDYVLLNDKGEKMCWGTVLESTPHSKLVYSFTHDFMNQHKTLVTWDLEASNGGTQLVMTHTGLDGTSAPLEMLADHDEGWDEHFAQLRKEILE